MRLIAILGCVLMLGCHRTPPIQAPHGFEAAFEEADFEKLGPPKPGEWRDRFPEELQSFEDYARHCSNKKGDRSVIYLLPLGEAQTKWPGVLDKMREYAALYFGCRVVVLAAEAVPTSTYHAERKQFESDEIIEWLSTRVPKDGLVLGAITNVDLFSNGLNYVFGSGSLENRCGVYSLIRMESQDPKLFLRRALGLMAHEFGHILSITHCVTSRCVMCGANSLDESDGHPLHPCPIDLRKLWWNLGFDVLDRYRKLESFLRKNEIVDEADWTLRQVRKLER